MYPRRFAPNNIIDLISSSTMRFIHINEYEYMNNYAQYIILHTRIRIQWAQNTFTTFPVGGHYSIPCWMHYV